MKGTVILEEDVIKCWDIDGESENVEDTKSNSASDPMAITYQYHKRQFEDLINAIESDRKPLVDETEGRKPVEIILAAYESSRIEKKVELE